MIFHDLSHASPEWFRARVGIATASCFGKIITPKTGKLSAQADGYANLLISEMILGESQEKFSPSYWMERGAMMEVDARKLYEFETGFITDRGGFMTNDEGTAGASPDVRVFDDGGKLIGAAEIKCPAPWNHVENLLRDTLDPDYIPQVQGQILIGGFDFVDFFSYHPDMPPARIRTYRDDEFCKKLQDALDGFEQIIQVKIRALAERGIEVKRPEIEIPKDNIVSIDNYMAG